MRRYVKIIVIGYGKIADNVLNYVWHKKSDYGYDVEFVEHETSPFGMAGKICRENGIPFFSYPEKEKLTEKLEDLKEETLILSASNNFLFPRQIVEKGNVTIVNFHNALLPKYPGRNAPSWVIYEGEEQTGITWHYVNEKVDEGEIILQKKCRISPDIKAYELADRLMTLAIEGFQECFAGILDGSIAAVPQPIIRNRRVYHSREVPGGGHFTMEDSPEKIYRLLRAADYGKNRVFPEITATCNGQKIRILRYIKEQAGKADYQAGKGFLCMRLNDDFILKMKYAVLN